MLVMIKMKNQIVLCSSVFLSIILAVESLSFDEDMDLDLVCESDPIGKIIGELVASGGTLPYEFRIGTPAFATFAELVPYANEGRADVIIKEKFNYEENDRFDVTFEVTDASNIKTSVVNLVRVSNANDNNPVFEDLPYTLEVYEYPWTDNNCFNFSVSDADGNLGGELAVTIPASEVFELVSVGQNRYCLKIKQNADIDYEQTPVLTIDLTVSDQAAGCQTNKEKNTVTTTAIISLRDGPDQSPAFATFYDQALDEETPKGFSVITVNAQDRDYSLKWNVTYSFAPDQPQAEKYFAIDETTGEITVKEQIDRESEDFINSNGNLELTVEATEVVPADSTFESSVIPFPFTVSTTVTIRIVDINDNVPEFYSDPLATSSETQFEASLDENTPNSISVPELSIFVQDKDQGDNAEFEVFDNSEVFNIFPSKVSGSATLVLRVANSSLLDYETNTNFVVELVAVEPGKDNQTATVTITLNDINDNQPVFESSVISANISESAEIGDAVVTVEASDKDSGIYQEITYSISSSSTFEIDPETGIVTLKELLDREQRDSYFLTVTATDGGGSSGIATLSILVLDENDEKPEFSRTSYSGTIKEESREFTSELTISATDDDEDGSPNREVTFTIIEGEFKDLFKVTPDGINTGKIEVVKPIDLESSDFSDLECVDGAIITVITVQAEDGGIPAQSSTVNVTIIIEDDNDNDPIFNSTSYKASVDEGSAVDTLITKVFATDGDKCTSNNDVSYQIDPTTGDGLEAFRLNSISGELRVRDSGLDRDEKDSYEVKVIATDPRGMEGKSTVFVTLDDVNDKAPEFVNTDFAIDLSESVPVDCVVWEALANDTDLNSDLVFNITDVTCYDPDNVATQDCTSPFLMEEDGTLKTLDELDREKISRYMLTITVEDIMAEKNNQLVAQLLEVSIVDENDNPPSFNDIPKEYEVIENSLNAVIATITATDEDEGESGRIKYSVAPEDQKWVSIDEESGLLTTSDVNPLDREQGNTLNVTIIATDYGTPALNGSVDILLKIDDVNDNPPQFEQSSYEVELSEDVPIDEYVITVNATDKDEGENAEIVYDITDGSYNLFDINRLTGEIVVKEELDRETFPEGFDITVRARDNRGVGTFLESETNVRVNLTDVNDNPPVFSQSQYTTQLIETAPVYFEVYTVEASDPDTGNNSKITFAIINDEDENFVIDSESGVVTLNSSIENGKAQYTIDVMAIDEGKPQLNSTSSITVDVIDQNGNDPIFQNLPDQVQVSENAKVGFEIFQVNATDLDRGPNGKVQYSLSENEYFTIDSLSGIIKIRNPLDRELNERHEVIVVAEDRAPENPSSTEGILTVVVTDVDDEQPYYENNEQILEISEAEEPGASLAQVREANDDDWKNNSINYYFIIGGSGKDKFLLDKATRILSLNSSIDREANATLDLVVAASWDPYFQPPEEDVDWNTPSAVEENMLHVIIQVGDINDNDPVFEKEQYRADIPFSSQPNEEAIITQVLATDPDLNKTIAYKVTETLWNGGSVESPFDIRVARDNRKGDLFQIGAITGDQDGFYVVTVTAYDVDNRSATTKINIGIIVSDETVVLYSILPPEEFSAVQDQFIEELGVILDAEVYVDSVVAYIPPEGEPTNDDLNSVISIHARREDEIDLVPEEEIISALSSIDNVDFLDEYGISVIADDTVEEDLTAMYLTIGIVIAGVVIVIIIIGFVIGICCMKRKYDLKLKVSKATSSTVQEMADFKKNSVVPGLPNTNDFAGGANPLYVENQKNVIDLDGWLNNQESQDDDDEIDDNAVDNQDSGIGVNGSAPVMSQSDDDQDIDLGHFDVDIENGDNARLAAALNAANQRRGGDNLTFMFDDADGLTEM